MGQEPPLVTITDPGRPGELIEVLGDPSEPFRPSRVQLLALSIALVLVAGIASAVSQTRADHREQVALARAVVGPTYVSVASTRRVALVVSLGPELAKAQVVGAHVEGPGWQVVTAHARSVGLAHEVLCGTLVVPPTAVRALVRQHGQSRTLDLLQGRDLREIVGESAREACGDIDADRAVTMLASPAHRSNDEILVTLTLRNRSLYDVRVLRVVVDEVGVSSPTVFPMTVPARRQRIVQLIMTVRECLADGQIGSNNANEELHLDVGVNGRGGPSSVPVPSSGLQRLAARLRTEKCGH